MNYYSNDEDDSDSQDSLSSLEFKRRVSEKQIYYENIFKSNHDHFHVVKNIYENQLSPTIVQLIEIDEKQYILKRINKSMLINDLMKGFFQFNKQERAQREMQQSIEFNHHNLIKTLYSEQNDHEIKIYMEYLQDADYFHNKIEEQLTPIKNELKLKSYIYDILDGLKYLNQQGYAHCDLKLENLFVIKKEKSIPIVKISDFGMIHPIDPETNKIYIKEKCGTFNYVAPELKNNTEVDNKIDMWSLGIILYKMSVAYLPTQIAGYTYKSGPIPFRPQDWKKRSPEMMDFVKRLLTYDPSQRMTIDEAYQHDWIVQYQCQLD